MSAIPHGTISGRKQHNCRCEPCTDAIREYDRTRARLRRQGRPTTDLVDAEPARTHLRNLLAAGHALPSLASAAGMRKDDFASVLYPVRGSLAKRIRAGRARRILAVPLPEVPPSTTARVPGVGTRRRVQALAAMGHPVSWQAREIGVLPQDLRDFVWSTAGASRGLAEAVRGLYDRWWDVRPAPCPVVTQVVEVARRHGWAPPLAWDDDEIDDPAAVPDLGERVPQIVAVGEDAAELLGLGYPRGAIAERLGVSKSYMDRALARHRERIAAHEQAA